MAIIRALILYALAVASFPQSLTVHSSKTRQRLRQRSTSQQQQQQQRRKTIVGGENADPNRYPSVVFLADREDKLSCGATLISPTVLLTAAHCEM
jgi:secreted trypsin-like serine protease